MKKKVGETLNGNLSPDAWIKRMASMFREVQKQKEYARHNPPMEKRTTRYLDAVMERGKALESDKILFSRSRSRLVTALLPKVVQALTTSYEAFRTDVSRFERNVRYAHNEYAFPQAKYAFRCTASVLALSIRRKES